jgi:hypothetical protein
MNRLSVTRVGRKVATSGLRPATADYLISYAGLNAAGFLSLIMASGKPKREQGDEEDLEFLLFYAALTSPEFESRYDGGRRNIPWQINGQASSERGST